MKSSPAAGIHGTILNIKDDILVVKIAENVKIEVSRAAVSRVKNKEDADGKGK